MGTGSAEGYHELILELERALFAYITAVHRDAGCGADGIHRAECAALLSNSAGTPTTSTWSRWTWG
jgi:hypothetical protein